MRLLLVEDDPRYRALLRHHLACKWPEVEVVERHPIVHGAFPREFLAQGFSAVLLDHSWEGGGDGLAWLAELCLREGFAPIVFLSENADDECARRALALGARAAIGKNKVDHEKLLGAVAGAADFQAQRLARWRDSPEGREARRFGDAEIAGYRRIRQLATGAGAGLFLAEGEQAGALVVLKLMSTKPSASAEKAALARFLQEHEIVGRIRHPGVVRLHDLRTSGEHAYLSMEYFPSGDLRRRMREGIEAPEALRLALEIARALEAVHAAGVLHRDLKPGNVMMREDGGVALIDFGLARHEALASDITDTGIIFGTPHYMSPEQGHGEALDERSDLYSLGVILYEMLARAKPYVAENPMAIIYMHRKSPIPRLPEPLASLQPLMDRLLAKSPGDRPPTAAAAAQAIETALETASGALAA
jgi:serine/threonine protein kinase